MRRIVVPIVDRANYGRLLPVLWEIKKHPELSLSIVLAGSMVLQRFGHLRDMLVTDGLFDYIDDELHHEIEGDRYVSKAVSQGIGEAQFGMAFERLRPDIVLLIGDRYQMFAAAAAANSMELCTAHIQGGEITGHNDDRWRWAISRLAQYHAPATTLALDRLLQSGEFIGTILSVGCPSSDLAAGIVPNAGNRVLCVQHPDADDPDWEKRAIDTLCELDTLNRPVDVLWPNIDAGGAGVAKAIRTRPNLHAIKNLHPIDYLQKMADAAVLVGNSSSFVREGGFFFTPAIIVGDRQRGREQSGNAVYTDGSDVRQLVEDLAGIRRGDTSPYRAPNVSKRLVAALGNIGLHTTKEWCFEDHGTTPGPPYGCPEAATSPTEAGSDGGSVCTF